MSTASPSISDFYIVICESKRIINAYSRHFLALSVLFLLPLSFSLSVFATLVSTFSIDQPNLIETALRSSPSVFHLPKDHRRLHLHQFTTAETLAFFLIFAGFALFLSICALGSITYSVFHGFYGRPVKLVSAVKSLSSSFIHLSATVIASQLVVALILALFGLFGYLCMKGIELIGVQLPYNSPYFIVFVSILVVALGVVLIYVQLNWALVSVVVVLESKWGFKPLARSRYLIRGMRSSGLALAFFFGIFTVLVLCINVVSGTFDFLSDAWKSMAFVVQIVVTSAMLTLLLLHSIAANTVLYMYCKALHGELAGEIAKEFAGEYVSLSCDDDDDHEKVLHVVSVVARS
ncbi:hypothetical protein Dimus_014878 [Dionaea muscipula]